MSRIPNEWIEIHQSRINKILNDFFNSRENNTTLHQACSYSVLNGGKRIRALLVYAVGGISNTDIKILATRFKQYMPIGELKAEILP